MIEILLCFDVSDVHPFLFQEKYIGHDILVLDHSQNTHSNRIYKKQRLNQTMEIVLHYIAIIKTSKHVDIDGPVNEV